MTERPGFMLYFEVLPALEVMKDEEAGRLFRALIAYGRYGEVLDLSGAEAVAFQMLRGRMDRDAVSYREKCRKTAYAAYVREIRRQGGVPTEYEDWTPNEDQMMSDDIRRYTTTTSTTNTTSISTTTGKRPGGEFSTKLSPKESSDTAWVLEYLEEQRQKGKKVCP